MYPTFVESIRKLPPESRLEVYEALMDYGMTNTVPKGISAVAQALIASFALGVDNAKKRREASIENGKLGGGQPGNQNARKRAKTSQNDLNVNADVNVKKDMKSISKNFLRHDYKPGEINNLFSKPD